MTDAFERGDLDEASRQGVLAGPAVIERALASPARTSRLAAITAAAAVDDRAELLPTLATQAAGADRRTAIPAAVAARKIARELATEDLPDDLGTDDVQAWRGVFEQLARNANRFVEVRVLALDTAHALAQLSDPDNPGFDLKVMLGDPDPGIRAAALRLVPAPAPSALRPLLANAVTSDADPLVALGAAQALCDDKASAQALRRAPALDQIRAIAARCLAK